MGSNQQPFDNKPYALPTNYVGWYVEWDLNFY